MTWKGAGPRGQRAGGAQPSWAPDGKRLKLYVNGELVAQKTGMDRPIARGRSALYVGKFSGNYFHGYIDEVMMFNFAMTDDEVQWHHDCYSGSSCW